MNEQIVKLFMQSVDSNYIPLPIEDHMPSWTEKFAELIVRECAFVAQNKDDTNIDLRYGRGLAAGKILEHFGVE